MNLDPLREIVASLIDVERLQTGVPAQALHCRHPGANWQVVNIRDEGPIGRSAVGLSLLAVRAPRDRH